ncbi:MAG: hypothetical protein FGM54_02095 [Chitinophagaceae bacterium]|nr:hypothetical protein [Chitinophagaceae bacterium]
MKRQPEDSHPPDHGPDEARRHAHWHLEQPDPRDRSTRRVRVEQDQPQWYLRRGYITQPQADALQRWQADAYLAGLMPACIGGYQQAINGGESELSDLRLAAQARRNHAIEVLAQINPHAVAMLDAVAVQGQSAGRWFMQKVGGPPSEALEWLNKISTRLAKHYGFVR